jgi:hypothetical protein
MEGHGWFNHDDMLYARKWPLPLLCVLCGSTPQWDVDSRCKLHIHRGKIPSPPPTSIANCAAGELIKNPPASWSTNTSTQSSNFITAEYTNMSIRYYTNTKDPTVLSSSQRSTQQFLSLLKISQKFCLHYKRAHESNDWYREPTKFVQHSGSAFRLCGSSHRPIRALLDI